MQRPIEPIGLSVTNILAPSEADDTTSRPSEIFIFENIIIAWNQTATDAECLAHRLAVAQRGKNASDSLKKIEVQV